MFSVYQTSGILVWLALLLCALPGVALDVKDVPNPQDHGGWVSDSADVIPSTFEKRINRLISRLNQRTSAEVAVVALAAIDEASSYRKFAADLFNSWGVGDERKQNGVLILVVQKDRRIEIITGHGLTSVLSEPAVRSIVDQMTPYFDRGDPGGGALEGVKQIVAAMRGIDRKQPVIVYPFIAWFSLVTALVGISWLFWFRQHSMLLPPAGRCDINHLNLAKIKFRELVDASVRIPRWPAFPAWLVTAALTLLGASAASVALASPPPDLEIGFLRFTLVGAVGSALVMMTLLAFVRTDAFTAAGAIAIAAGVLLWMICNWVLWSDRMTISVLVPCFVAGINLVSAKFVTTELAGQFWCPRRFACSQCRTPIQELDQDQTKKALSTVEQRAVSEGNVLYRGWRCSSCQGEHLCRCIRSSEIVCDRCKQPTYTVRVKKGWRYLDCFHCNHRRKQRLPSPAEAGMSAAYASSSYASAEDDEDDNDSYTTDSSSYDSGFSGGGTDGSGAGGNWHA